MELSRSVAVAGRMLAQHVTIYKNSVVSNTKQVDYSITLCRMKIVDDDIDWRELAMNKEEKENRDEDEEEEAPVVTTI